MNKFFESPSFFVLSAFTVGYILLEELDGFEQNAIGNWLMLVGQVLETSATLLPSSPPSANITNFKYFDQETLKKVRDAIDRYTNEQFNQK